MDTGKNGAELMWRLARVWWAGFKVFCRWVAFWIVLSVLWLPAAGVAYLLGEDASPAFVLVFVVLFGPIIFYLTSRYLLLLGDDHNMAPAGESPAPAKGQEGHGLRKKIVISTAVAYLALLLLMPSPDPFTALVLSAEATLFCGVPLLILARSRFLKAASGPIHSLVCALVCLAAVLLVTCLLFFQRITRLSQRADALDRYSPNVLTVSSLP